MADTEEGELTHKTAVMRDEETQVNGETKIESESPDGVNVQDEGLREASPTRRDADEVNARAEDDPPSQEEEEPEEETTKFVEWDPTGRFGRTTELLGRGTYKNVYKAFDEEEGMDVAWNQVKVHGLPAVEKQRLLGEVEILKRLDHKNVLKFYHSWNTTNEKTGEVSVNFITEACAGTLNKYAARFKNNLDMRAVKSWARQILRGLEYLHSHEPPIVHRDLKCDNIFVNGNAGEIKIGDLGLAAMLDHQRTHSVIGTPEFMAPELYEEDYDERVDIYSFGMCLIELVTFECPYNECKNPAQIYKRVSSGIPPAALETIKEKGDDIYEFISLAIAPADERPTAQQLLDHVWLKKKEKKTMVPRAVVEEEPEVPRPIVKEEEEEEEPPRVAQTRGDNGRKIVRVYSEADTLEPPEHRRGASLDVRVKGTFLEDNSLRLRLRIADSSGQNRTVEFPFNTETDSARSVATEMVEELGLEMTAVETIEREIEKEVKYLWDEKRGFCERPESRRHSAENSGGSSPEEKLRGRPESSRAGAISASASQEHLAQSPSQIEMTLTQSPSTESLSEKPRILVDDHAILPEKSHAVQHEESLLRPKSAFAAVKPQEQAPVAAAAARGTTSGLTTPGDASPPHATPGISPVRSPAPVQPAEVARSLEQVDLAAQKPPRAPVANAQPTYSESVMQDVQRVIEGGSSATVSEIGDRGSDAGSYANEEEQEEMEELRLLEELELQQQQEEAEMRQRHTTERQQKLRSLQKKRIERTASKMALLTGSDTGSESARYERPHTPALATQTVPQQATRLMNVNSASNLGLPPQPPQPMAPQHSAPGLPPPTVQTSPPPLHHVQHPVAMTSAAEQPHFVPATEPAVVPPQVAQLQTDSATISRTNSLRSMKSDSDAKCVEDPDLPPEEQARLAKEKKRIEALAKMQMMEETSLLSLDVSKSKGAKGSMMSLSSKAKKDSADELQQHAEPH